MKKNNLLIIIILISCLYSLSLVSAEIESLGTAKQSDCIDLKQSYWNSTSTNITSIQYPNKTSFQVNYAMTKDDVGNYNYTFCDTIDIGQYLVTTTTDVDGIPTNVGYDFEITSTGEKVSLSNIILVLAFLIIAGVLFAVGITFDKNKWMVKSFFFIFSLLMLLLSLNSARIIASESLNLGVMANIGLIALITIISFMFLYIMILWTIDTIKSVKEKRGVRWQY